VLVADPTTVTPRPAGFVTNLVYQKLYPGTSKPYVVLEPLIYESSFRGGSIGFTVKAGFRYDRASVPRIANWFVPKRVLDYGAAIHDVLYDAAFDKDVADRIFYLIVRTEEQAGRLRGRLAWRAVQFGGWPSWHRHREEQNHAS